MKELIENPDSWSAIAENYNVTGRRLLTPFSERAVAWADVGERDEVLDVACGGGTTTVLLAPLVKAVTAIDFSAGMIEVLRRNCAEMPNVRASVDDGQRLELPDESFDAAFSMFGLMFFPDPIAGLQELFRVLRPGGRVAISSWPPLGESPMMLPMMNAVSAALELPSRTPPSDGFSFDSAEGLAAGLEAGGFVGVEIEQVVPEHHFGDAEGYWALTSGNIGVNAARTKLGDDWPAVEQVALAHVRESLGNTRSLAMPGLVGFGRKSG